MAKIDFRKIVAKNIEGEKELFDISKELGNQIYKKTSDLGELELAREIYHKGEVDINELQANTLSRYVCDGFKAFIQEALNPVFEKIINSKK